MKPGQSHDETRNHRPYSGCGSGAGSLFGFLASVMDRVREEAAAPPPIPFPWKRALPGMALVAESSAGARSS